MFRYFTEPPYYPSRREAQQRYDELIRNALNGGTVMVRELNSDFVPKFNALQPTLNKVEPLHAILPTLQKSPELAAQTKADALKAQQSAEKAVAIMDIDIATTQKAGIVKVDGVTTFVDANGKLSAILDDSGAVVDMAITGVQRIPFGQSRPYKLLGKSLLAETEIDYYTVSIDNSDYEATTATEIEVSSGSKPIGSTIEIKAVAFDTRGNKSRPAIFSVLVSEDYIEAPTITSPPDNVTVNVKNVKVVATPFAYNGIPDTHAASRWQVLNAEGFVVFDSGDDAVNKTEIVIAEPGMEVGGVYGLRVRYKGELHGWSDWSYLVSTTALQYEPFGDKWDVANSLGVEYVFNDKKRYPGFVNWPIDLGEEYYLLPPYVIYAGYPNQGTHLSIFKAANKVIKSFNSFHLLSDYKPCHGMVRAGDNHVALFFGSPSYEGHKPTGAIHLISIVDKENPVYVSTEVTHAYFGAGGFLSLNNNLAVMFTNDTNYQTHYLWKVRTYKYDNTGKATVKLTSADANGSYWWIKYNSNTLVCVSASDKDIWLYEFADNGDFVTKRNVVVIGDPNFTRIPIERCIFENKVLFLGSDKYSLLNVDTGELSNQLIIPDCNSATGFMKVSENYLYLIYFGANKHWFCKIHVDTDRMKLEIVARHSFTDNFMSQQYIHLPGMDAFYVTDKRRVSDGEIYV